MRRVLIFMKTFLISFISSLILFSCSDEILSVDKQAEANLDGNWNVIKYTDIDGREYPSCYIIFLWYENGLAFVEQNQFYPRHNFNDGSGWFTNYDQGPGSFLILSDSLMLSYEDFSLGYSIDKISSDSLILSNLYDERNPWKGIWVFVKE